MVLVLAYGGRGHKVLIARNVFWVLVFRDAVLAYSYKESERFKMMT